MSASTLILGDCVEELAKLPASSIDAVVTDPPYGLEFMGKEWDSLVVQPSDERYHQIVEGKGPYSRTKVRGGLTNSYGIATTSASMQEWHRKWAVEALRALKPGGHLLAFGGTRTYHRLASAIEDAGFEIRDTIAWTYSTGFPKSLDVSKAIDRAAGVTERPVIGEKLGADRLRNQAPEGKRDNGGRWNDESGRDPFLRAAGNGGAIQWDGWGTALKPAHEPIIVARKPLEGTVAENVQKYGTGALNIDGGRVGFADSSDREESTTKNAHEDFGSGLRENRIYGADAVERSRGGNWSPPGRWPPNLLLTHDPRCVRTGTRRVDRDLREIDPKPEANGAVYIGRSVAGNGFDGGSRAIGTVDELVEAWTCVEGCPVAELDRQSGESIPTPQVFVETVKQRIYGNGSGIPPINHATDHDDSGGASRFFPSFGWEDEERSLIYVPKASRSEREAGVDLTDGKSVANYHPCLSPESVVVTDSGSLPISEVKVGTKVYSADGRFHVVTDVSSHEYTEPIIEVGVLGTNSVVRATHNHPFLIWRPVRAGNRVENGEVVWVEASDLRVGDYTMTPILNVPETPTVDALDFWWMVGLYLAEGCALRGSKKRNGNQHAYPHFSLHVKEMAFVERLQGMYGESAVRVYPRSGTHGMGVVVFVPGLHGRLLDLCGAGAATKRISPEIFSLPLEARRAFFEGYMDGDGAKVRTYRTAKTVSSSIAYQMGLLAESLGYHVNLHVYPPSSRVSVIDGRRIIGKHPIYYLTFYNKNDRAGQKGAPSRPTTVEHAKTRYVLRYVKRVASIPYNGQVWNLTVEGNHTFQTAVGMTHNTVKPIALMRYLVRLVTPPNGTVLDPFVGSGTTGCAAVLEGLRFIGIEKDPSYLEIAKARIAYWERQPSGAAQVSSLQKKPEVGASMETDW